MSLILCSCARSPGLLATGILRCLRRDEKWLEREGRVGSPPPIGQEWRKGEEQKEGPQVNTFCDEVTLGSRVWCSGSLLWLDVFHRKHPHIYPNLCKRQLLGRESACVVIQ